MNNLNPSAVSIGQFVTFENTDLRIIDRDGCVWLTGADLSRALGYAKTTKVTDLYNRNKHEFSDDMTALVTLDANEINSIPNLGSAKAGPGKTRVYSSRGCHLIAMLSRTEKAGMFRRWALDVLENLPSQNAPSQKTYLPNADHLSLRDTMMHPDAFEKILDIAECMTGSHDVSDWERAINKRAGRMAAERLEEVQMDAMMGVRMLTESDHIGGFKTTMLPNNARLLLDNEIADYIRSASGPRMRMLPDIIHACTERLNELYELPLHGLTDDEG